jgi:hypothetical protein
VTMISEAAGGSPLAPDPLRGMPGRQGPRSMPDRMV